VARGFLLLLVLASPGLSSLAAVGEVMPWGWRVSVLAGLPLAHLLAVVALCACEGRRGAELERAAMRESFSRRLEAVMTRRAMTPQERAEVVAAREAAFAADGARLDYEAGRVL
jgi:hypothetical protein